MGRSGFPYTSPGLCLGFSTYSHKGNGCNTYAAGVDSHLQQRRTNVTKRDIRPQHCRARWRAMGLNNVRLRADRLSLCPVLETPVCLPVFLAGAIVCRQEPMLARLWMAWEFFSTAASPRTSYVFLQLMILDAARWAFCLRAQQMAPVAKAKSMPAPRADNNERPLPPS